MASRRPSDRESGVWAVEHEVVAFITRVRAGAAATARDLHPDLTASAYRILVHLDADPQVRITDLAAAFEVGKPTMSRQVAALEGMGFVRRRPDPSDGRGALVSLTDAGRSALTTARTRRHEWVGHLLRDFSDDELRSFAGLLNRFVRQPPVDPGPTGSALS